MGMAYLAAWQGPVYDADDPYGDGVTRDDLAAVKHVQQMLIIDGKGLSGHKGGCFQIWWCADIALQYNSKLKDKDSLLQ